MKAQSQKKTLGENELNTPKPKKRDRSGSEAKLMKAAEETFAKHGFAATTTKLIAQKAKLNEALIARYFGGKAGLLVAIVQHHIENKHGEIDYPIKATLEEELTAYILKKFESHCSHSEGFFRIVLSQVLVDAKFAKRIRSEAPLQPDMNLVARMQKLVEHGKMRSGLDLEAFGLALQIHISGIFLFEQMVMGRNREEVLQSLMFARDVFTQMGKK